MLIPPERRGGKTVSDAGDETPFLVSVQVLPAHQLPHKIMNPNHRAQDMYIISPNLNVILSVIIQGFLLQYQKTGGSNLTAP